MVRAGCWWGLVWGLATGCEGSKGLPDLVPSDSVEPAIDLVTPVPAGEARAGVITDSAALFGGVSADGRVGDVLLVNDRARFVVQGLRDDGGYFVQAGGGVIDADVVRPAGEPGRDLLDEFVPMYGAGRVLEPTSVEVVSTGRDGGPAIVEVRGVEAPMALLEGALEAPGFLPTLALDVVTTYTLPPDSHLLEVHSQVTARDATVVLELGDLLMGSRDAALTWHQGTGLEPQDRDTFQWSGFVGARRDVAVATLAMPEQPLRQGTLSIIEGLADMTIAFGERVELPQGASTTWTRWYGVGPDLATLSNEALTRSGIETEAHAGVVTADDGPVGGAWVAVYVDERPYTLAVTAADGSFSALVPSGSAVRSVAIGRGTGLFEDIDPSSAPYPPYGVPAAQQAALDALLSGSSVLPPAEGRGVASEEAPWTLGVPGTVRVDAGDSLPFYADLALLEADAAVDSRVVLPRPRGGRVAAGWARDGTLEMQVPEGTYRLIATRGARHEVVSREVEVLAGELVEVSASMPEAFRADGWLHGDPHSHASPSADASTTMVQRLLTMAGMGVQVHFGTDHDHVADYRPLVDALGLSDVLTSVVADEVSPPLRGHMNIYPLTPEPALSNQGAWQWWNELPSSTEDVIDRLLERHGPDIVIQANHPTDDGVLWAAGWSEGEIAFEGSWTDRFTAVEVLNAGSTRDYLSVWWDLITRGHPVTPVGVSDAHGPFSGHLGLSGTYLGVGVSAPSELTDAALVEAMRAARVVVSRGPFLELSVSPGSTVSAGTTVTASARSASWIGVDRLILWKDGEEVQRASGPDAVFELVTDTDAVFVITAEGDQPMQPVDDRTPWAMSGPYFVDVAGDGWTPPKPPLVVGD